MAQDTIRLTLVKAWDPDADSYEVDAPFDATFGELLNWLKTDGAWLEPLEPGVRHRVLVSRTNDDITPNPRINSLDLAGGEPILIALDSHGAGPGILEVGEALAAAKLAIDAVRLALDAYRAQTERMGVQLERERFEHEKFERRRNDSAEVEARDEGAED